MINERVEAHDLSNEDVVEKDVAYLVKNFRKFLKFKNNGQFGDKGKFPSSQKEKNDFKRKDGKESQSTQGVTCFECNGQGHFKKVNSHASWSTTGQNRTTGHTVISRLGLATGSSHEAKP